MDGGAYTGAAGTPQRDDDPSARLAMHQMPTRFGGPGTRDAVDAQTPVAPGLSEPGLPITLGLSESGIPVTLGLSEPGLPITLGLSESGIPVTLGLSESGIPRTPAPTRFGGPGTLDAAYPVPPTPAAPLRRRPRRATVLTAVAAILVAVLGLGGMWFARSAAYAERIPGPTAAAVIDSLLADARAGSTEWTSTATADLAERFGTDVPFAGGGLDVTLESESPERFTDRGRPTNDATLADAAAAVVTASYALGDGDTVTVEHAVTLTRALTRDDDVVISASPWRVSDITATEAESTLTVADVCGSAAGALTTLSTSARVDGSLDSTCTRDGEPRSWLPSGADEKAWLADFPVYGPFALPTNALHVERGVALTPLVVAGTTYTAVVVEATSTSGEAGWVLVHTAEVAK